jgi:hypothetical protein
LPGFARFDVTYTGEMIRGAFSAVLFWWKASAGNRLRPWRSEYLRWRLETYTGKPAGTLELRDFVNLAVTERRQLGKFLVWMGEVNDLANGKKR